MTDLENSSLNTEMNEKIVEIEGYKDQFLSVWYSIKRVLQEEIPDSPADVGFLMEVMGDLANQIKDTTKVHKLKLPLRKWIGAWNCLNVCLRNDLFKSQAQEGVMCEIQSIMAVKIDAAIEEEQPPEISEAPAKIQYDDKGLDKAKEMVKDGQQVLNVVKHTKEGLQLFEGGKKE